MVFCSQKRTMLIVGFFFISQFFQRNGRPYPISNRDYVLVEITHGSSKIPPNIQYGGKAENEANKARVAFTVHRSGEYRISIMIGARHIRNSPFNKKFKAGTCSSMINVMFISKSPTWCCWRTRLFFFLYVFETIDVTFVIQHLCKGYAITVNVI